MHTHRQQPNERDGRQRWIARVVVMSIALGIIAGAATVAHSDPANVTELQTGDCFDGARGPMVGNVNVLPCAVPHDAEVIARLYPKVNYSGRAAMGKAALNGCVTVARRRIVNTQYQIVVAALFPNDRAGWSHDPHVLCLVEERNGGKLIGSMTQPPMPSTGS